MANVRKADRVEDTDIKRLNHSGLGLKAIADILGCHPATITLRLDAMGVKPTDTRRSFMEQVYKELSPEQQTWLSHNLYEANIPIRDFIVRLIQEAFDSSGAAAAPVPVAMPEMDSSLAVDPATLGGDSTAIVHQAEALAASTVHEITDEAPVEVPPEVVPAVMELVSPVVAPEYVGDQAEAPVCDICHLIPVEVRGQICAPCQKPPETKTASIFG